MGVELCYGLAPCSGKQRRTQLLYVLTLGVLHPYREAGLGSHLVRQVCTLTRSGPLDTAVRSRLSVHRATAFAAAHNGCEPRRVAGDTV